MDENEVMGPVTLKRAVFLAIGVGLFVAAGAQAPRDSLPPPSPPLVAPARAWLVDDFSSGTLDRWRVDRSGVWAVTHHMLRAQLPDRRQEHSFLYAGDSTWTDYSLDADVCGLRGVDKGFVVRVTPGRGLGIDLRGPGYQDVKLQLNQLPVGRATVQNGNVMWHHVRIEIQGSQCHLFVDGDRVLDRRVPFALPHSGGIALAAYTGGIGECTVFYDNIVVAPLGVAVTAHASR